ncbi:MAG: DNA primase [Candidatus Omnitrophota bacterium]
MSIDERTIDQISAMTDIVQVIAGYIPVKRAGANFKAVCPFHQEKTPSFMISPQKQIYHCFGCGAGGNVFSFIMKYENMTFPETVRHLAAKCGVTVPEKRTASKNEVSRTRLLLDVYKAAFDYYRGNFMKAESKSAQIYLEKRGFSRSIIDAFGVGYARNEWRGLLDYLRQKGFHESAILSSGLVLPSSKGAPYDFFRDRIIFPIINIKEKVVAFGGRTLTQEEPKYINTSETEHFRKRFELYGLYRARRKIREAEGTVIIVEGYLDVMRLYQVGLENVVAPLGTALTRDHVRILKRYAEKAIMIFDGDSAGLNASLRSINAFLEESLCVEIVILPKGYDPDSFVTEQGRDAFCHMLKDAQDIFDFKLNYLLKKFDKNDSSGLIKITDEMFEMLHAVKNTILRDRYIRKLSECLGIHEGSLREEMHKKKKHGFDPDHAVTERKTKPAARKYLEELSLLHILISEPILCERAFALLSADDFERPDAREIFVYLGKMYQEGERRIDFNTLMNRIQHDDTRAILSELPFFKVEEDSEEEALAYRICEIKMRGYKKKKMEIHECIMRAVQNGDDENLKKYQQMKIDLQEKIQELKTKGSMV